MEKTYCVYMHINKINNKKYIGITCQLPKYRWDSGYGYQGQELFWNAIQKYGWENFEHHILFENLTETEAKQIEINLIKEYHTCVLDEDCWGYNLTRGGEGYQIYVTKEEKHQAYVNRYKRANKVKYNKLKNDQEAYQELLKYNRENKRNKLKDPAKHEKLKEYNRLDMQNRRQDPVYAEKQRELHRINSRKATIIRNQIIEIFKISPELFSDTEINYVFEKGKTGWKNQSIKKLQAILDKLNKILD